MPMRLTKSDIDLLEKVAADFYPPLPPKGVPVPEITSARIERWTSLGLKLIEKSGKSHIVVCSPVAAKDLATKIHNSGVGPEQSTVEWESGDYLPPHFGDDIRADIDLEDAEHILSTRVATNPSSKKVLFVFTVCRGVFFCADQKSVDAPSLRHLSFLLSFATVEALYEAVFQVVSGWVDENGDIVPCLSSAVQ